MKLFSLSLKNFKGIRDFTLDTGGEDVSIYGDNATGKTTLMDAFLWLLFGKDSANRADFDIKTLTEDGQALHGLDHSVEATIEIDGRSMTLQKVYSEKWTKRRGEASKTFTGHTTDHFIDGVPVKKKEYDEAVAGIVDEDVFKLLTNPRYFNDMLHWQDRRKILLEVCGDVSDGDVIASDKALAKLPKILGSRSLDDHRKVIAARRAEINRELDKVPVRIDEVTQGLPELPEDSKEAYTNVINILKELKRGAEARRLRIEAGGEIAEKQKALAELDAELLGMQNILRAGITDKIDLVRSHLNEVTGKTDSLNSAIRSKTHTIKDNQAEIERLEARMALLREDWGQVNSRVFEFEQDDTCPTCGQALPKEQLEAARDKALASFNQSKAKKLEDITAQGKDDRARAGELALQNAELEKEVQAAEKQLEGLQKEGDSLQERINELSIRAKDTVNDPAYVERAAGKKVFEDAIAALKAGTKEEIAEIKAETEELDTKLADAKSSLSAFDAHDKGQTRIKELEAQERELAAEYERLEEELYLTEEFIRAKVRLLEDKINSRFEHARFKLFSVLVNGGIEETCMTTFKGVPWGTGLNNGAQINVGLDIINTLSEYYGFSAPIFVDNAESVSSLIPAKAQLISLVVSEQDKKLRVEIKPPTKIKEVV